MGSSCGLKMFSSYPCEPKEGEAFQVYGQYHVEKDMCTCLPKQPAEGCREYRRVKHGQTLQQI